jgi:cytochrome c oxidase assembly protein subunit 15
VHYWAVLTALVTLPLLLLGAEVTTKQVGLVDPDWPTPPWQLWLSSWRDSGLGFLIEHGHRLAGYTVGTCVIVLVLALWLTEPRRWVRWLGVAALAGVVVQGVLGGLRVKLHALFGPNLALIHGTFGQMVFALLAALAACTSRRWTEPSGQLPAEDTENARRWSLIVVGLLLLQLVLGAMMRHQDAPLGKRGHLLVAFAVVAAILWLARTWQAERPRALKVLVVLVAVQILLGVESWMTRFTMPVSGIVPPQPLGRDLIRSAHVLVGAMVLATAVVMAMEAYRRTGQATDPHEPEAGPVEFGIRPASNLSRNTEALVAGRPEGAS